MGRMRYIINKSFWAFATVAVIFLGPSSGLVTLTVPNEPNGGTIGIPDTPHLAKRASDDSQHLSYDVVTFSNPIHHSLISESLSSLARVLDPQRISPVLAQIRAPPSVLRS
jgi:hypothetical protein